MKAAIGDRLVTGGPDGQRECLIIGLQHTDGSPPYVVRWLADGHLALVFPGPYTRLVHGAGSRPGKSGQAVSGRPGLGGAGGKDEQPGCCPAAERERQRCGRAPQDF